MGLGRALKRLFGGGSPGTSATAPSEPVRYGDYVIRPAPERTAGGWNTAGFISKTFDDGPKETRFIRVDTHMSRDDALAFSIKKAQQIIDQQGDQLFDQN